MAYIVPGSLVQIDAVTGAGLTVTHSAHEADDTILHYLSVDAPGLASVNPSIGFANSAATISAANDTVGYTGSDVWANGDQVTFTGTTLPGGLTNEVRYFIRDLDTTANTFKVAATAGGAAIDITSAGNTVTVTQVTAGANSPYNGWQMIGTQAVQQGHRAVWAFRIATSDAHGSVSYVGPSSEEWTGFSIIVRDAHATAPFGSLVDGTDFAKASWGDAATGASAALTTAVDDCLLLYSWGIDGSNRFGRCKINELTGLAKYSVTGVNYVAGYKQVGVAGAAPSVTMYNDVNTEGGTAWTLAIRNKTNGALQPDIRPDVNELKWYGSWNEEYDGSTTWNKPSTFYTGITEIGDFVVSATDPTVANNAVLVDVKAWNTLCTTLTSAENITLLAGEGGLGAFVGGWHTIPSTDLTNKIVGFMWEITSGSTSALQGSAGLVVGFSDGTNAAFYQIASKAYGWAGALGEFSFVAPGNATLFDFSGTVSTAVSGCTRIGFFLHRITSSTAARAIFLRDLAVFGTTALTGGGASRPAKFQDYQDAMIGWGQWEYALLNASSQVQTMCSLQIGDGTNKTYFDGAAQSLEFPQDWSATKAANWQMFWNANASSVGLSVKASASDTIKLASGVAATDTEQPLTIHADSSTSATYDFAQSFVGWTPTWKTGVACVGATFSGCDPVDFKGASPTNIIVKNTLAGASEGAISFDANGATLTTSTIDITGTSAGYHISLGASVTSITLNGNTFTGTPGTDKIYSALASGTLTITWDGVGTSIVAGDVTFVGGSTAVASVVSPTVERGQNFTGLVAGSKVKVFTSGTQTVLYGTDSSGTSFAWDDATTGSITVDYTIQQAGYLPIRVTGIVLTGAVGTGQVDTPISQVVDRAYSVSSGLTYGTTAVVTVGTNPTTNPGTKTFQLSTASTGQNWYSFWIEQWIDKGDTGEALANVEFPLQANGPNSFTLLDGWEFSDGATSIAFLSRDGIRYTNTSGTRTAAWAAILTAGVPSGARVRYQQSDGGTTGSAVVTSGNMDELLQVYGDATHGNFDRTGYLVLKVQEMGYDQAESDVYATYGTLEDQLYVVGLAPTANTVATGNPSLANPPTITDHGASPVTWNSKYFSITITDSAAGNTGTDIMKWLRYNFETGGTFQSKDGFNWHDLVQQNGDDFKTVRGKIYGDTGATLKGVRVVTNGGTDPHPDFNLFTADDGTTYAPPPAASVTISGLTSGSRVQLYDTANSTELYNDTVAGTSLTFSETYSVDRTVRVRITYVSGASAKEMIEATVGNITSGNPDISYIASQSNDATYNTNAVDGSTVTNITINDTTDRVEIAIAGGSVTWSQIYAYQVYWLNTEVGIRDDFAFIESPDPANYILTNFKIKNTHPTNPLTISGGWGRDSGTGLSSTIIDTTSTANIYLTADHVIPYATGSGVTSQDKVDIAAEVLLQAQSNPIYSEIIKVAGETVTGSGTEADPWGPV